MRPPDSATTTPAASFCARVAFAGLWTIADRQGRLEDRPRWIKGEIFPYDDVDMEAILTALHDSGFITRYVSKGGSYILINRFLKHQSPHVREPDSLIPAPVRHQASTGLFLSTGLAPGQHDPGPSVSVPESVPVPESESESLSGDGDGEKSSAAERAARPRPAARPDDPEENVRVITKLVYECLEAHGDNDDLTECVKHACARHHIAYDSTVVGHAIDSARRVKAIRRKGTK